MNLSTITNTALSVAGQAANLGLKAGQEVFTRLNGLRGGGDDERATYSPTPTLTKPDAVETAAAKADSVTGKTQAAKPVTAPAPATKSRATGAPKATTKPIEPKADAKPATAKSGRFVREVSDPKKARKLRARKSAPTAGSADAVEGATGHGGTPASVDAENTPKKLASAGKGREAAPLGATDDAPQS